MVSTQQPITNFPMVVSTPETGTWEGKPTKLEDEMFDESEVSVAESRLYTKEGRAMKFFLAEYDQPRAGLYHNPMNCYNSQGFTLVGRAERRPLKTPNRPDTEISLTTWTRKRETGPETVIVAYWYEIGDHTMYERSDLLRTQIAMFGKSKWPMMFKVLLEMPAGEPEQTKSDLMGMAQAAREWLGTVRPVVD